MKKIYFTLLALVMPFCLLQARPVDQQTAHDLAQKFVAANFKFDRQSADLTLVKTGYSNRGEACYFAFNVGETGFIIIAADDCVRPIIGHSDEGIFNPDDMAPALADFLEVKCMGISDEAQNGKANPTVAADWEMLEKCGRLVSRHGGKEAEYLVQTKWNQSYPYNYFCPEAASGPGGHCYAGCVATAASQVMKYWNHPIQGQGSYTYTPEAYPQFGPLTANFGETTYDWDNMPVSISANSPQVQIEAVALLQYHVGVSMDMNYRPDGSGAVTNRLTSRMPMYFFYTPAMTVNNREDYTHDGYMELLINTFDMRWPIVQAGGGHAYVFDGYNDFDQVHANWGWGGSSDGWFDVDGHGYTDGQRGIFNYVPVEVYAATPNAPTDFEVTPATDNSLSATITWKNPAVTLTNEPLQAIDQIVVTREGQVIYSADNVTPGDEMSFVDETVPYFDCFDYAVYAITDGKRGTSAFVKQVLFGPTCDWKIVMQSSAFLGWCGAYVSQYSATGKEIRRMTITSSVPNTITFAVPVGSGSFGWTKPTSNINSISLVIKDSENNTVYTYSGHSSGIEEGIFLNFNNGCGNTGTPETPSGLTARVEEGNAILTWDASVAPYYGFNIYRDERLYAMVDGNSQTFIDEGFDGGHCYTVTALDDSGESLHSNETCASSGDCMGATNFFFEYTGNNYKIKLLWDKPEIVEGLSGYYLYRKYGADGTYERVKLLGASATSYTDNTANVEGDYYYRLYAYYGATDCTSSPASVMYNPNLFYLHVYYSPTSVDESDAAAVSLFPNPADHSLKIEAEGMTSVKAYNMLGQMVLQSDCDSNSMVVNVSAWGEGVYVLTIDTKEGRVQRRVTIVH